MYRVTFSFHFPLLPYLVSSYVSRISRVDIFREENIFVCFFSLGLLVYIASKYSIYVVRFFFLFFFIINMNFVRISLYSRLPFFPWLHEIYFFEFLFNFSSPVIVAARFLSLFATSQVCDPGTLYQLVPLLDAFNFRSRFLAIKTL